MKRTELRRNTPLKRKRDTPRRRVAKPRRPTSPRRSKPHRDWIETLPCATCGGRNGVVAAHLRWHTDGGTGIKPSDWWTWPACFDCHITDQHQAGEPEFFGRLSINPWKLCLSYARRSPVEAIKIAAEIIMLPVVERLSE